MEHAFQTYHIALHLMKIFIVLSSNLVAVLYTVPFKEKSGASALLIHVP